MIRGIQEALMKPLSPIASKESPREILAEDYKSMNGLLPIKGGWGYTRDDACVIDMDDPIVPKDAPFNGVTVEYSFVEKRIWEEMIIFREREDKYAGIEWSLLTQRLDFDNGHTYDMLEFEITAIPRTVFEALKAEWEGPDGFLSLDFDREAHNRKHRESTFTIVREFWFDITSFFGK
jgi:hypothetical protein